MQNNIKKLVDDRGITVYRFRIETGISAGTAYRLYKNPGEIPRHDVLESICRAYNLQPGEILTYIPDEATPKPVESDIPLATSNSAKNQRSPVTALQEAPPTTAQTKRRGRKPKGDS